MIEEFIKLKSALTQENIDPILYGSLGVSLYLGNFKTFNDIDLLIEDIWLEEKWHELIAVMKKYSYILIDEKEHEFISDKKVRVAFAKQSILKRDNICYPETDLVEFEKNGVKMKTLKKEDFLKAYLFSSKDGYRKEKRGKNDQLIINLLSSTNQ